jgi:hypothetical protein
MSKMARSLLEAMDRFALDSANGHGGPGWNRRSEAGPAAMAARHATAANS